MPQVDTKVEEITVAEIVGPQISERTGKPGPYKIKDSKGRKWSIWSEAFERMNVTIGSTYAAMYTSKPYTYTDRRTGMEQTGTDNTIVGLNPLVTPTPLGHTPPKAANGPVAVDSRDENIAVLALTKVPELVALARQGDVATGVKVIRTLRLMWREAAKQAAIMPSGDPQFDPELNDGIPF